MKRYNGNSIRNARITINYEGKKPKVKFSYPGKKENLLELYFYVLLLWGFLLWLCTTAYISMNYQEMFSPDTQMKEKFIPCVWGIDSKNVSFVYDSCRELQYPKNVFLDKSLEYPDLTWLLRWTLLIFLPPFLLTLLFKPQLSKVYPKFQGGLCSKKLKNFTPKEVQFDGENYFVEIPFFENVYLEYKAVADFSKNLKIVKIREHHFKYSSIKGKKTSNERIWKALFYLKNKPENGYLRVIYH